MRKLICRASSLLLSLILCFILVVGCNGSNNLAPSSSGTPAILSENSTPNSSEPPEPPKRPNEEIGSSTPETSVPTANESEETAQMPTFSENTINITVGDTTWIATLADNSSAEAFRKLLEEGSITINMSDYARMEKVGDLGHTLPKNDKQITTEAGDMILYQGNMLVLYYAPNAYSLTRMGKINNVTAEELKSALGTGSVEVTFSLAKAL